MIKTLFTFLVGGRSQVSMRHGTPSDVMRKSIAIAFGVFLFSSSALVRAMDQPAEKDAASDSLDYELRLTLGAQNIFIGMWGFIPEPFIVQTSLDTFRFFRAEIDLSATPMATFKVSLDAGSVFPLYDSKYHHDGIFQLKIPVLIDLGYLHGMFEEGDSYADELNTFFVGPSCSMDFSWWVRNDLGVNVALTAGYMFKIGDMGSYAPRDYGGTGDEIGFFQLALSIGIAISN